MNNILSINIKLILWYIKTDYFPDDRKEIKIILINKSLFIILFIMAFMGYGFLSAFENTTKQFLDDPYVNSIPCNANFIEVEKFEPEKIKNEFPQFKIDPIYPITTRVQAFDENKLSGLAIESSHPYFSKILYKNNIIWENRIDSVLINKSIILNVNAFNKIVKKTISFDSILNTDFKIKLTELEFALFNDSLRVYAVCRNLPIDKDFIIFNEMKNNIFKNFLDKGKNEENKKNEWLLTLERNNLEFEEIFNLCEKLTTFFEDMGIMVGCMPDFENDLENVVKINFRFRELSFREIESYTEKISSFIECPVSILDDEDNISKELLETNLDIYNEWKYFTMYSSVINTNDIYNVKDSLDLLYPGISMDMKSIDMVNVINEIEKSVRLFQLGILFFFLLAGSILNYKLLSFHIYRKKNQISYMKTIGVSKSNFKFIYSIQALFDTTISVIISIIIAYALNNIISHDYFIFSFKDYSIFIFVLLMLFIMILIYRYNISKIINKSFREALGTN